MNSVEEIEIAVTQLPQADFSRFRAWLADYENDLWDRQIADDSDAGKLDALISRAQDDIKNGRVKPLDEILDDA